MAPKSDKKLLEFCEPLIASNNMDLKSKNISIYNPDNQIEFSKPFKEFKKYKFEQITDEENNIENEDKINYLSEFHKN